MSMRAAAEQVKDKNRTPDREFCGLDHPQVRSWLALRAGVLRRAISCHGAALKRGGAFCQGGIEVRRSGAIIQCVQDAKRRVSLRHCIQVAWRWPVGHVAMHSPDTTASTVAAKLRRFSKLMGCVQAGRRVQWLQAIHSTRPSVLSNHSLNRTHCGVPAFGPPFHSGPNTATPQWPG